MKMLNNVLIKLIRGGFTDRVLFVDNVPEEMFYEMRYPRKCEGAGQAQHYVADTSKPKVPTLYGELSESQTGDKGIVFNLENENAKARYLALDRYIKSVYPNSKVPAEPVVNSTDPTDSSAPALALSQVPRVVLPALSPVGGTTASSSDVPALDVDEIKKQAVEEYKKAKEDEVKERMAAARAARSAKSA